MGTQASDTVAYIRSSGSKQDRVAAHTIMTTISRFVHLNFGEERKVKVRGDEIVFQR